MQSHGYTLRRSGSAAFPGPGLPTATDGRVLGFAILDGSPDADSIVNHLQGFVDIFGRDMEVRAVAESLLRSTRDNDLDDHAGVLLAWVRDHVRYLPDPDGAEMVVSPLLLLRRIRTEGHAYGDCDDHVVLLGSLLQSVGIVSRVHAVKIRPGDPWYNHVILSVGLPGGWTDMDPCAKNGNRVARYMDRLVAA